jgi:murein DD-endopeptidase MepM/ murein hydrolase activator NlpD
VAHPGVYFLDENSRIIDAVEAAGGFTDEADQDALNLAARVENAQILEIPTVATSAPDDEQSIAGDSIATSMPSAEEEMDNPPDGASTITAVSTIIPSCTDGPVGSGVFVWPADNHFLSGNDYSDTHPGIDIAAGEGSPVYAADSGVIIAMGNDEFGYGNIIQIDHGNGYSTVYAHLSDIEVVMCQAVEAGQRIGAAGSTGNSRGPHLHFEVIQDNRYMNPWSVLP